MSFKQRAQSAVVVLLAAVSFGTVLVSALQPVQAATVGNSIACFVYTSLNDFGSPIQFARNQCPSVPAQGGALTVVKQVINSGAGSATPADFQIHVTTAGTDVSGSPQPGTSTGMTYSGLTPGVYTVREAGAPTGYAEAFSGNCDSSGNVVISQGASVSCIITDTYSAPAPTTGTLDVIKYVSGGSATSTQASIHVLTQSGVDVAGSPQAGSSSGTLYILAPGIYSVIEAGNIPGYSGVYSGNCTLGGTVVVTAGGNVTCAITDTATNSTAPGTADLSLSSTVSKSVVNYGDIVTYSLVVTNAGPSAATGVIVHDLLPAGLAFVSNDAATSQSAYASSTGIWTIGTLNSGATATLHVAADVTASSTGGMISNGAAVLSSTTDPLLANNAATSSITIGPDTAVVMATQPPVVGQIAGTSTSVPTVTLTQSSAAPSPSSCGALLTGFIKPGGANDPTEVAHLQAFLKVYEGAPVTINGTYDAATIAATEAFQVKFKDDILAPWGITAPTGYVYLTTRHMVNEVYCQFSQTFPLTPAEQSIISASRTSSVSASAPVAYHHVMGTPITVELDNSAGTSEIGSSAGPSVLNDPFQSLMDFFSNPFGGLFHWLGSLFHHQSN